MDSKALIDDLDLAIAASNFGRLTDICQRLLAHARTCPHFADATLVAIAELARSPAHRWDAVALARDLARVLPEQSDRQHRSAELMLAAIHAMADPAERAAAAHTVLVTSPASVLLQLVCADLLLDELPRLDDPATRQRYAQAVLVHTPPDTDIETRARAWLGASPRVHSSVLPSAPALQTSTAHDLTRFVERHRQALAEIADNTQRT